MCETRLVNMAVISVIAAVVLAPQFAEAAFDPIPEDDEFVPFLCDGEPAWDPHQDDQSNHRDIVGDADRPAVLRTATDDYLYLRLRLDGDPRQNDDNLRPFGWGFLFDVPPLNFEDGEPSTNTYDYLLHLNGTPNPNELTLHSNEGYEDDDDFELDDPTAPAAGEIQWTLEHEAPDLVWHVKEAPDEPFGDEPADYWLTIAVPWENYLIPYGIEPDSMTVLWTGTTTSNNAIDRDFACHDGDGGDPVMSDFPSDDQPLDPSVDPCDSSDTNNCSENSTCVSEDGGAYSCDCDDGYYGEFCTENVCEADEDQCSDDGQCVDEGDGDYSCDCDDGYYGEYCEENVCDAEEDQCSDDGQCVYEGDGGYSCDCDTGYYGEYCEQSDPDDPCADDAENDCSDTATCISEGDGEYSCECDEGYYGEYCDENACEAEEDQCSDTGECVYEGDGAYSCDCDDGYYGEYCEQFDPDDPCADDEDNDCSEHASCITEGDGEYSCECDEEFAGDGTECVAMVQIDEPSDGGEVTTSSPTVTGTGEPGSTVTVYVDGEEAGTAEVDEDGNWSWEPDEDLDDGEVTITAESTTDGGTTTADSTTFTIDTETDGVTITTDDGATFDDGIPVIEGTAEPNSEVDIYVDGEKVDTVTTDENGNWSWEPDESMDDGDYEITAEPADEDAGDGDSITVEVDTGDGPYVSITSPEQGGAVDGGPTVVVTGEAEPGSEVDVYVDGEKAGTTTADEDGNWEMEVDVDGEGEHEVEVVVEDSDGNTSSASREFTVLGEYTLSGGGLGCIAAGAAVQTTAPWMLAAVMMLLLLRVTRRRDDRVRSKSFERGN